MLIPCIVPLAGALLAGAVAGLLLQDGALGFLVALFYGNVAAIMAAGTADPLKPQVCFAERRQRCVPALANSPSLPAVP